MTFKVEGFSVPKLQERLTDLTAQNIFSPDIVIIDGVPGDGEDVEILKELKALSASGGYPVWVTVLTHRHDETDASGLPVKLAEAVECFDAVIQLQPEKDKIHVRAVKGTTEIKSDALLLDPQSHLITVE
jgi:predicted glycosyltransferase